MSPEIGENTAVSGVMMDPGSDRSTSGAPDMTGVFHFLNEDGSSFSGRYSVKMTLPCSQAGRHGMTCLSQKVDPGIHLRHSPIRTDEP